MSGLIWTLIVLAVIGAMVAAYFFIIWKKDHREPNHLTFRHALTVAKEALKDKEHPPELFRRLKDHTEVPFDAKQENKSKAELPGTYHFRWPHLQVGYTNKDSGEKIVIQIDGHKEIVTAYYSEGAVNGVKIGDEDLDLESFDMRHAGTISDQMRSFVRYHLRFPDGTLKVEKAAEPTFKPVLDLKKPGEIKLHGKPPPGPLPNFKKKEE